MEYEKISETELAVTKPVEKKEEVTNYSIDFLKQQELDILKSKNDFCEARDKELSDVRELLAKCEELDIKGTIEVALSEETSREEAFTNGVSSVIVK